MFTFTQSNTTSAITPIIPIHEDTIEIKSARIIKMVIGFPKYLLKLNNKVCPETIVNLLIAAIKKVFISFCYEAKQYANILKNR